MRKKSPFPGRLLLFSRTTHKKLRGKREGKEGGRGKPMAAAEALSGEASRGGKGGSYGYTTLTFCNYISPPPALARTLALSMPFPTTYSSIPNKEGKEEGRKEEKPQRSCMLLAFPFLPPTSRNELPVVAQYIRKEGRKEKNTLHGFRYLGRSLSLSPPSPEAALFSPPSLVRTVDLCGGVSPSSSLHDSLPPISQGRDHRRRWRWLWGAPGQIMRV